MRVKVVIGIEIGIEVEVGVNVFEECEGFQFQEFVEVQDRVQT